jgi:hypothetical protein
MAARDPAAKSGSDKERRAGEEHRVDDEHRAYNHHPVDDELRADNHHRANNHHRVDDHHRMDDQHHADNDPRADDERFIDDEFRVDEEHRVEAARWLVVGGRRWRRTDPALPADVVEELKSHLGRGRSGVGAAKRRGESDAVAASRTRVGLAKHGLGERGPAWWDEPVADRITRARDALAALAELDAHPDATPDRTRTPSRTDSEHSGQIDGEDRDERG